MGKGAAFTHLGEARPKDEGARGVEGVVVVGSVLRQQRGFGSSSEASFFGFAVWSKSALPEGDFERSDLPLFSSFVPASHAVGLNLRRTRLTRAYITNFMPCCGDVRIFDTHKLIIYKPHRKTVYFKTLMSNNEATVLFFCCHEHSIYLCFTASS